jgi:IclR family mhp operon transcriptional activator
MPGSKDSSAPTGVKSIRALERGLDVLLAVRASGGCGAGGLSLNALHHQLGLPKATLLRLLQTLASRQLVWRRLADGVGMPGALGAGDVDPVSQLAEIASPLLVELSGQVVWPSVMAIPRFDHMEIIETNGQVARFDFAALGPVGAKLSYLHTATGRAYLAACENSECDAIISRIAPTGATLEERLALDAIIAQTRERGWSTRLPHHSWSDRNRQTVLRDGKNSIAVAVVGGARAIAAVNITWPARRATVEEVAQRHLASLQAIAARIGQMAVSKSFTWRNFESLRNDADWMTYG